MYRRNDRAHCAATQTIEAPAGNATAFRQSGSATASLTQPKQPAEAGGGTEPDMIHCLYCGLQRGEDTGEGWLRCGNCGTL